MLVSNALEIRDEVGFFQEVRAVLAKSISEGGGKSPEELELAVRQIVSRAISSDKVIDIFDAAGLKKSRHLTGSGGAGVTVSDATAQMFDPADPDRPMKAFLQEYHP